MGEIFVTADTHIDHYNIVLHAKRDQFIYENPNFDPSKPIQLKRNYPYKVNLESHNEYIVEKWNNVASKRDQIWILGDFAWRNHARWIHRLNGKKYLIRGNHDKMPQEAYRLFQQIEGSHYQYSYYTKIKGQHVMLSHCPYYTWFSSCHGSWNLYGHCHGRKEEVPWILSFDCGWDAWGGLIPWDIIVSKMKDKEQIRASRNMSDENRIEESESEMNFQKNVQLNSRYMNGETNLVDLY